MTAALEESLNDKLRASQTGDRFQVVVHVPAETFCQRSDAPSAVGANGPPLHPETVKRLTCDGALVSMLENEQGRVLHVGRKTRVIPSAIRRAMRSRDQCCRYPGCSHTKYVDGHHIVHWSAGGETRLDNLVLLCRRHHRLVHEFGHHIRKTEVGFEFVKS